MDSATNTTLPIPNGHDNQNQLPTKYDCGKDTWTLLLSQTLVIYGSQSEAQTHPCYQPNATSSTILVQLANSRFESFSGVSTSYH
jgi:hypothetical protein